MGSWWRSRISGRRSNRADDRSVIRNCSCTRLLVSALASSFLVGCAARTQSPPPPEPRPGMVSIRGCVLDASTGYGLPKSLVRTGGSLVHAVTSETGCYVVWMLPPGVSHLEAVRIGYRAKSLRVPRLSEGQSAVMHFWLTPYRDELQCKCPRRPRRGVACVCL
jgi:hypothetical protein